METNGEYRIDVILNPLRFFKADFYLQGHEDLPNCDDILRQLCSINIKSNPSSFMERYKDFKQAGNETLNMTPADKDILDKMIFPLQHAKNSYLLGNYIGTISLCGMVSEMIAIFLHRVSNIKFNNKPINKTTQKRLYGSEFEKLGQERRINILHAFGIINEKVKGYFDIIRTRRRRYLHFFSQEHSNIQKDALECIESIEYLMLNLMGPKLKDGKVQFNPDFMSYLVQQGIVQKAS